MLSSIFTLIGVKDLRDCVKNRCGTDWTSGFEYVREVENKPSASNGGEIESNQMQISCTS